MKREYVTTKNSVRRPVHKIMLPWGGYIKVAGPGLMIAKIRANLNKMVELNDESHTIALPKGCLVIESKSY